MFSGVVNFVTMLQQSFWEMEQPLLFLCDASNVVDSLIVQVIHQPSSVFRDSKPSSNVATIILINKLNKKQNKKRQTN